jgi:hypothetical protein
LEKKEKELQSWDLNKLKTQKMRIKPSTDVVLTVNGRQVEEVKSCTYLGSIVTVDGGALESIHCMRKANGALMQLYPVWRNKSILVTTKIQLFHTYVKSVVLYGCAMRKITERISNSL